MQRDGRDLRVPLAQALCEQNVRQLRIPITRPGPRREQPRLVRDDARLCKVVALRRQVHDPRVAVLLGRGLEGGEQQLGQQRVAHVVRAELDLVALVGLAGRRGHDAGIVDEDVEAGRLGQEFLGGGLDGGEGCEVEREVGDLGVGHGLLDGCDGVLGFGCSAGGEVDVSWVVFGDLQAGLLAQSGISCEC